MKKLLRVTSVILIQAFIAGEISGALKAEFPADKSPERNSFLSPQLNFGRDVVKDVFLSMVSTGKQDGGQKLEKLVVPGRGSRAHKAFVKWFLEGKADIPLPEEIFCLTSDNSGGITVYNNRPIRIKINVNRELKGKEIIHWPINDPVYGPILATLLKEDFIKHYKGLLLSWQALNQDILKATDDKKKKALAARKNVLLKKLFLKFIEFPPVGLYRPDLENEKLHLVNPAEENLLSFLKSSPAGRKGGEYFYPLSKEVAGRGEIKIGQYLFNVKKLAGRRALIFAGTEENEDLVLRIFDQDAFFEDENIAPLALRYFYFGNGKFSTATAGLRATADYILQRKDNSSVTVEPRQFRRKISGNGILHLMYGIQVQFGKYPEEEVVVVPKKDSNFGYVFFVYRAQEYDKDTRENRETEPIGYFIADLNENKMERITQPPAVEAFVRYMKAEKNIYGREYLQDEFVVGFNGKGIANVDPEKKFVLACRNLKNKIALCVPEYHASVGVVFRFYDYEELKAVREKKDVARFIMPVFDYLKKDAQIGGRQINLGVELLSRYLNGEDTDLEMISGQISAEKGNFIISINHGLMLKFQEDEYKGKKIFLIPDTDTNYGRIFKVVIEGDIDNPLRWYYPDRETKKLVRFTRCPAHQSLIDFKLGKKSCLGQQIVPQAYVSHSTIDGYITISRELDFGFRTTLKDKDVLIMPVEDPDYGWLFNLYDNDKFKQGQSSGQPVMPICVYRYDENSKKFYRFNPEKQSYIDFSREKMNSSGEFIKPRVWHTYVFSNPRRNNFPFYPAADFKGKDIVVFPEYIAGFGWLFNIYEEQQFKAGIAARSKYLYALKDGRYEAVDGTDEQRLKEALSNSLDSYRLILSSMTSGIVPQQKRSEVVAVLNSLMVSGKIDRFEYLLGLLSLDNSIKGVKEKQALLNRIYFESVAGIDIKELFEILQERLAVEEDFRLMLKKQVRANLLKYLFSCDTFAEFINLPEVSRLKEFLAEELEVMVKNKLITPSEKQAVRLLLNGKNLAQISEITEKQKASLSFLLLGSYLPQQQGLLDVLAAYYKKHQGGNFSLGAEKMKLLPADTLGNLIFELTDSGVITAEEADLLEYYAEGLDFTQIADKLNEVQLQEAIGITAELIEMEEEDKIILSAEELRRLKKVVAEARKGQINDLKKFNNSINRILGQKVELELPGPISQTQVKFKLMGNNGYRRLGILDILDKHLNKMFSVSEIDALGEKFYARLINYAFEQIIFSEKDAVNADMANRINAVLEEISAQEDKAGKSARALLFWKEGMDGRYSSLLQAKDYENGKDEMVDINLIRSVLLAEGGLVDEIFENLYGDRQNDKTEGLLLLDQVQVCKTFSDLKYPDVCFKSVNNLVLSLREKMISSVKVQNPKANLDAGMERLIERAI